MKKIIVVRHDIERNQDVVFRILNNEDSESPDYFYMEETEELKKVFFGNTSVYEVDELSINHFDIKPGEPGIKVNMALEHDKENLFGGIHQVP